MALSVPDRKVVGDRLRTLRGSRTLEDVANAVGVTSMAVSMWERGERAPSDEMKIRLANYYKKSISSIFFSAR